MQRLAAFEQNVVGHVHDIGNGPHAHGTQAVPHAHGRGNHLDLGNDPAGVQPAELRVRDFNGHHGFRAVGVRMRGQVRDGQGQVEGQGRLPRQAQHGKAVRAVGRDGDVQHLPVQIQHVHKPRAHRGVFRQDHNAAVVLGEAQFPFGADHAERRRAAQFSLLDHRAVGQARAHQGHGHLLTGGHVGRAADDIQQFALARVHLAAMQMVGIRMPGAFRHIAHHDGADGVIGPLDVLQLQAKHGQPVAQRFGSALVGRKFTQP